MMTTTGTTTGRKKADPWWNVRRAAHISYSITRYTVPPLALVTNGLSLIVFSQMHRAKQQVIDIILFTKPQRTWTKRHTAYNICTK